VRDCLYSRRRLWWCAATLLNSACALGAPVAAKAPSSSAPFVLYLDVIAGPSQGGENNLGAYVSVFGRHFEGSKVQVHIGGAEVARYLYKGPSRGLADVQQITVQVGALGHAKPGVPLPVQVTVDGAASNTDQTFTIQPGDFLFVDNVAGNDATAKLNDIQRPWRHVQNSDGKGGALAHAKPGDTLVLRGKKVWSDRGRNERWFRFRHATGSAPTGKKGTGYLTILGYPGENARFRPSANSFGGIHGIDSRNYPGYSQWITIAGLSLEGGDRTVRDAPINLQVDSNHWRIVNNDIGPWDADVEARSAGISGNGRDVKIFGNHIHDIGGGVLNHCLYLDTGATDVEVAYNHIHGCTGGNIVQTYDNLHVRNLRGISIHHNLMHDGNRYGLNISDGTVSAVIRDNIIYNTAMAALRLHVDAEASSRFVITHNILSTPLLNDGSHDIEVVYENNEIAPPRK
jgi:signal peptidase I